MFWYINQKINQKINLENIRIWFLFKMKLLFIIIIINVVFGLVCEHLN
jgi:hypothetical protein